MLYEKWRIGSAQCIRMGNSARFAVARTKTEVRSKCPLPFVAASCLCPLRYSAEWSVERACVLVRLSV